MEIQVARTVLGGDWGRRGQLKVRRHQKMLEVFSDISYGANAGHRSIQRLVVCYAGVPIAWQRGAQPFVAHSTAEAELIAYCESLVVGKATQAWLCAIWGEDINSNTFDRDWPCSWCHYIFLACETSQDQSQCFEKSSERFQHQPWKPLETTTSEGH